MRLQLRTSRPSNHSCLCLRQLSTTASLRSSALRPNGLLHYQQRLVLTQVAARSLSLSSLLSPRKVAPSPTPQTVANIAAIEAEANAHPHDVLKQLALFDTLLATNMKPGYEVLIARWERMCEFVRMSQPDASISL